MHWVIVSLFIVILSSCTFGVPIGEQPKTSYATNGKSKYGNPPSYRVFGKRYYVMDSAEGYAERGLASWYGPDFHGKRTSSGEVYNMHAMTAAHKTLPLPTFVRVKNLENGKSIVVKVNDRGPFKEGRIIDLSYAAAKKLNVVGPGTARVEVTALDATGKRSRPKVRVMPLQSTASVRDEVFIQLGSFGSQVNAKNLQNNLTANNEKPIVISRADTDKGIFYRVRLGPLLDLAEADSVHQRLKRKGFTDARIVFGEN